MTDPVDTEEDVLTTGNGQRLLETLIEESPLSLAAMERLRREFGIERFQAAVRLVSARTKAPGKLPSPERLWLDPIRVEQATHQTIAAHKARRFAGTHVADICCGIGGDTFALAGSALSVVAVDLDRAAVRRLAWNLDRLRLTDNTLVVRGDAARPPVGVSTLIHIDPDRRSRDRSARPTSRIEDYLPSANTLRRLMQNHAGGAIKLGPASDFEALENAAATDRIRYETEIVSLLGECKEATLWFGDLAGEHRRTATILPAGISVSGRPIAFVEETDQIDRYLFEADSALLRSGLIGTIIRSEGLQSITADGAWLTGPCPIDSPWLTAFEVLEEVKVDRKVVRAAAKRFGWRTAVVKTRGAEGADRFLKWFDSFPQGTTRETLLIRTVPKGGSRAFLALRRVAQARSERADTEIERTAGNQASP